MLLTRTVLKRKKLAASVLAAIRVHGPRVVAKLEELFAPMRQDGQAVPNYAGDMADLESQLVTVYDKIEQADDIHLKDVAKERRLRRTRNGAAGRLQQVLLKLSQTIDSSYGPNVAEETLGLGVGLRAIPDQIYDIGRRARDLLSEPDFAFEQPVLQGVALSAVELTQQVEEPLGELADILEEMRNAKREFDETRQAKVDAIDEFNATFSMVATWLKGMFLGAGETELAAKIRPKIPASAKPSEDEKVVEVDDETGEEKEVEDSEDSESSSQSEDSSSSSEDSPPSSS